jgi:hypothetical protein
MRTWNSVSAHCAILASTVERSGAKQYLDISPFLKFSVQMRSLSWNQGSPLATKASK